MAATGMASSVRTAVEYVLETRVRTVAVAIGTVALPTVIIYAVRIVRWWRGVRRIQDAAAQFPHLPRHWLLGNLIDHPGPFGDGIFKYYIRLTAKFERAYSSFPGPVRCLVSCCHPDTAKVILKTSEPKSRNNYGPYHFIHQWLGNGLLISSGPTWQRNRKLLTPAFHFDVLKPYVQIYNDAANTLIAKWERVVKTDPSVEVYQPVSLCTLDIIMRCAFSYEADVQTLGETHPYVKSTHAMSKLIMKRLFAIYLYPDSIFKLSSLGRTFFGNLKVVRQMAHDIIEKRKKALQENPEERKKKYLDFLDILLLARDDQGKGLTDHEIRQEVDTFLFEGHDTTASAVSWCLHTLARHAKEQTLARKEVDDLLQDRDNDDLEWADLHRLPYLTMCVKESLRLNPPVPVVSRQLTEPIELIPGTSLPPGCGVTINIYAIHHNPLVWGEDFQEFKPERFSPENMEKMDSHAFIPFSAGPRNCIGQNFALHEVKIVVAKLLHRFELKVDERYPAVQALELVLRSQNGIRLLLTPIH